MRAASVARCKGFPGKASTGASTAVARAMQHHVGTPQLRFGVVTDLQWADIDDGYSVAGLPRHVAVDSDMRFSTVLFSVVLNSKSLSIMHHSMLLHQVPTIPVSSASHTTAACSLIAQVLAFVPLQRRRTFTTHHSAMLKLNRTGATSAQNQASLAIQASVQVVSRQLAAAQACKRAFPDRAARLRSASWRHC